MKNRTKTFFGEVEIQFHCWKSRLFPCTLLQSFVLNRSEVCSSNWPLCQSVLCHTSILSLILLDSSTIFDTKSWDAGFFFFWPLVFLLRASHSVLHARHGQYVRGEDDLNSSPLLLLSFSLKDGLQLASGTCLFHTVNDHHQDYFSQNLKFPVTLKFPRDLRERSNFVMWKNIN